VNGTRDDLLALADRIDHTAREELLPGATNPVAVLADRGYGPEQAAEFAQRKQEAYDGATQYAAKLRARAAGMDATERAGEAVVRQAEMVEHAAAMGGWLSDNEARAWEHAQDPNNRHWGGTQELEQLESGTHHDQQKARTAEATGNFRRTAAGDGHIAEFHLTPTDIAGEEDENGFTESEGGKPKDVQKQVEWHQDIAADWYCEGDAHADKADWAAQRAEQETDPTERQKLLDEAAEETIEAEECFAHARAEEAKILEVGGTVTETDADADWAEGYGERQAEAAQQQGEQADASEYWRELAEKCRDEGNEAGAAACEAQAEYEKDHPLPPAPKPAWELPNPLNEDGTVMTDEETAALHAEARAAEDARLIEEFGTTGPTNADFDWTSDQEECASGLPSAQDADYSEEPHSGTTSWGTDDGWAAGPTESMFTATEDGSVNAADPSGAEAASPAAEADTYAGAAAE
jgi:hypothetical protein